MANGTIIPPGQAVPGETEDVVVGGTLDTIEKAALDHQVVIAHKFPRSLTKFQKDLTDIAQMSPAVAMEMMYSVPRAGKQLIGPSVRFAEALISCWGNATATVEVIDTDKEWVTAEGRFYDAETNVRLAVRVRRRITDKDGRRFNADMIGVTGAAASSIALRGAILRGVPKALWADKFEMAKETAVGKVKSIVELRDGLIAEFAGMGVTEARLLNALEVQGKPDITAEHIIAMASWKKSLRAGEQTIEELFGSADDDEIEDLMRALGWNAAKQKMSIEAFKGKRADHLSYLRAEVAKKERAAGSKPAGPQAVEKAKPAEAPATAEEQPKPAEAAESKPEEKPAAESKPEPEPEPVAKSLADEEF